ncbi:MAG: TraX family protein [Angelakisella sp.]
MSGFWIKVIALVTMTLDHVGLLFFPEYDWLRAVGRVAFPLFAYCAAEGARYTHDRKGYLTRLLVLGALSEVPFDLLAQDKLVAPGMNVCFTLAAGVACVWLLERRDSRSTTLAVLLLAAVALLATDYSFPGVLAVVILHHYAGKQQPVRGMALACLLTGLFFGSLQLFSLAAVLPIALYNGKRGPSLKYTFYLYYPLHMLVLWVVFKMTGGVIL